MTELGVAGSTRAWGTKSTDEKQGNLSGFRRLQEVSKT